MSDERLRAGWMDRRITIWHPQSRHLINLIKTDILDHLPLNEYISGSALKTLFLYWALKIITRLYTMIIKSIPFIKHIFEGTHTMHTILVTVKYMYACVHTWNDCPPLLHPPLVSFF